MERTYKKWGEKNNFFENDLCEISFLKLKPLQRCSWHKHKTKHNLFYVIDKKIWIKLEDGKVLVEEGQIFTVNPGEWHEFQTGVDPALVIEVMFVKYDAGDIDRAKLGGDIEEAEVKPPRIITMNPFGQEVEVAPLPCNNYQGSNHSDVCVNCGNTMMEHSRKKLSTPCYTYHKSKNGDYCENCGFLEEAHYRDI